MAKLRRAVDIRTTAGIDPEMKSVAFVQPGMPTPRQLTLSRNGNMYADPTGVPSDSNIRKQIPAT